MPTGRRRTSRSRPRTTHSRYQRKITRKRTGLKWGPLGVVGLLIDAFKK